MKCIKCNVSSNKKMLFRTSKIGLNNMKPMCINCLKVNHPEKYKKEIGDTLNNDLSEICYGKPL